MKEEQTHFYPVDAQNLRNQITQQIRDAIVSVAFLPGERLVELTLAKQMGVSRAPVREALSALEREGIVINIPRRGFFVIYFTDQDIEEIYSLRTILEIGAMARTLDRLTPEAIAQFQAAVDALGEAIDQKHPYPMLASLDLAFHELICRVADHGRLYSAWDTTRMQTWLLIGLTSRTHIESPRQPRDNHQRILDAMVAQDRLQVEAMLNEHFQDAKQRARRALQEYRTIEANRASYAT